MIEIKYSVSNETAVAKKDDNIVYHFATDETHNRFNITLLDPNKYLYALRSSLSILFDRKIMIEPDRSQYELWLEYELLRISEKQYNTQSTREDVDIEDYETIKERRDDLLVRVRSQIAYMDKAVKKIPLVKKRLIFLWGNYTLPILSCLENYFNIHVFTDELYTELSIKSPKIRFYHGFTEITPLFYESIESLNRDRIVFTNERIEKRPEIAITKLNRYEENVIDNMHLSQVLLYFIKNTSVAKHIELNRVQTYDLLSKINSIRGEFTLAIKSGKEYSISIKDKIVNITIKQGKKTSIRITIPATFIRSIELVLPYIRKIRISDTLIGSVIQVYTDNFMMSTCHLQENTIELYNILYSMYNFDSPNKDAVINQLKNRDYANVKLFNNNELLQLIMEGKIRYISNSNSVIYKNMYSYNRTNQYTNAMWLRKIIRTIMVYSKTKYTCIIEDHDISVRISNRIQGGCSCGKSCDYEIALKAIILEDKHYE